MDASDDAAAREERAAAIEAITLHPGLRATATDQQLREWEEALRQIRESEGMRVRASGASGEALEMQVRSVAGGFALRVRRPSGLVVRELRLHSADLQTSIDEYLAIVDQMRPDSPEFSLARIEVLDVAKRLAHDEAARCIRKLLGDGVVIDLETARRLFTLLCVVAHLR